MTNKDFLSQLNDLKYIRPQKTWLKSNREILLSQISNSGAAQLSYWQKLRLDFKSYSLVLSKPAIVMTSLVALLLGTTTYAHLAFNNMRYDDSLYIAKRISEKAKVSLVFNTQEREKLEAKFAAGHAEDIITYLVEANIETQNKDQVAVYTEDFRKELNIVKEKIASSAKKNSLASIQVEANSEINSQASSSLDDLVVAAESGKDTNGTQINIQAGGFKTNNTSNNSSSVKVTSSTLPLRAELTQASTTTGQTDKASSSETALTEVQQEIDSQIELMTDKTKKTELIIDETQELLNANNLNAARDKIKEVRELIK